MRIVLFLMLILSPVFNSADSTSEGFYRRKDSLNYVYIQQEFKKDSLNNVIINKLDKNYKQKKQEAKKESTKRRILTISLALIIIIISLIQQP